MKNHTLCLLFPFLLLVSAHAFNDADRALMESANAELRAQTQRQGRKTFVEVGERIPNFALIDQNGAVVNSRQWRGQCVILNFIFTRCSKPDMCPAATRSMVDLQKALKAAGIDNVRLVSISFDPEFDTPERLSAYAAGFGADTQSFTFLTGPAEAIEDLMKHFGVLVMDDDTLIYKHTLQTTLIDPEGKVAFRIPGSRWSPQDFISVIRRILKPA